MKIPLQFVPSQISDREKMLEKSGTIYRLSGSLLTVCEVSTVPRQFQQSNLGSRGVVKGFSLSAGVRMRRYLRECVAQYSGMVTLTYPGAYSCDGRRVKDDLRRFIRWMRDQNRADRTWSAFWFMEFQARGAPHFHIFTTHLPDLRKTSKKWFDIVGSEDERHFRAGTRCELLRRGRAGTVSYASKYAAKAEQKSVPDEYLSCGRFWGVSGLRTTVSADTFLRRSDAETGSLKAKIDNLNGFLAEGIQKGKIKVVVRKHGAVCLALQDEWSVEYVRRWIDRVEMRVKSRNQDSLRLYNIDTGQDYVDVWGLIDVEGSLRA